MDRTGRIDGIYRRVKQELEADKSPKAADGCPEPKLYVGRAENLDFLSDESVDVIITSPPYNLGSEYWPMGGEGRIPRTDGIGYEDAMPEADYQTWQLQVLRELYRVAKPGASLFYNHKVRQRMGTIIHPLDWLRSPENPWTLRQEIIWDRGSTHNHSPKLFWPHDERIYWLTKGQPVLPDRPIGMPTIWSFPGPIPNTWHPAPFPEELPRRCLQAVGRPGIVVLDPFGGSMATCAVAQSMGYESIGVDVNPEYVERARRERGWTISSAA
jgi:DNA modification methylase